VQVFGNEILKEQKLKIGLDLGDRWSFYCVLDEAGKILLEQKVRRHRKQRSRRLKDTASLIAMETGTHSPWLSRPVNGAGTRSDRGARTKKWN